MLTKPLNTDSQTRLLASVNIDQKTFCSAPWFQIRQQMDGSFASCCEIKHQHSEYTGNKTFYDLDEWLHSDYLNYLKSNLNSGTPLKECRVCWDKESNNLTSLRKIVNNTIANGKDYNQSWLPLYFKNKQDFASDMIVSADIKTSNVCNFACAMCHPYDSSQIHALYKKEREHPFVQTQLEKRPGMLEHVDLIYREGTSYALLEDILSKQPRYLKLLGGEPLLDKKLLQTLADYPHKNKTTLMFVTNGSVDLCGVQEQLQGYKTIQYTVSLEGVGKIQEYIRRGSNWANTEQNILAYIKRYTSRNLSVHHTMQVLSIMHFDNLLKWAEQHSISLTVSILQHPSHLNISALPAELFNTVTTKLKRSDLQIKKQINEEITEVIDMHSFVKFLQAGYKFDEVKQQELLKFFKWYDPDETWKQTLSEMLPYLV